MASQGPSTRLQPQPGPPPAAPPPAGGVDLTTLLLSAVASAAAAYITSKIWAPGALASAAMSPIIVALVKEALRKPTEVVTAVVPTRTRGRGGRSGGMTVESERVPADLREGREGGAPGPCPAARPPPGRRRRGGPRARVLGGRATAAVAAGRHHGAPGLRHLRRRLHGARGDRGRVRGPAGARHDVLGRVERIVR